MWLEEILGKNKVNTMAANGMAPCVARASATLVLTMWDKQVLIFISVDDRKCEYHFPFPQNNSAHALPHI